MAKRGLFFALEGGDGSGKGTQAKLLVDNLRQEGRNVLHLTFPRYGMRSAVMVERYLRGEFGEANDVSAWLAAAAFALDRVAASPDINDFLDADPDNIAITDRFVLSNASHQATKIASPEERTRFYDFLMRLEYDDLRVPRPTTNAVLLVPTAAAQANVDQKAERSYTQDKRDIHERDGNHLDNALRNYQEIAEQYPDEVTAIWAYDREVGHMRSIEEIQAEIRSIFGI